MHIGYSNQFIELASQIELAREIDTVETREALAALEKAQLALASAIAEALGLKHTNVEYDSKHEMGNRFAPAYEHQPSPTPQTITGTLYIAPGEQFFRVYAIPHLMKAGQSPADIPSERQDDWQQVGTMRGDGKILSMNAISVPYLNDLQGKTAGMYKAIQWQTSGEVG